MLCKGSPLWVGASQIPSTHFTCMIDKSCATLQMLHLVMQSPPASCYVVPLALQLMNWKKAGKYKSFSTRNQGPCLSFTSVFAGCWNTAVSFPKLDTTSHLLIWDGSGQGSHHGLVTSRWCASRYLDNSLSWNWGPFFQKYTHRVSKNYSGIKCQQKRLIWNSNCWIIYSAMSR